MQLGAGSQQQAEVSWLGDGSVTLELGVDDVQEMAEIDWYIHQKALRIKPYIKINKILASLS